MNNPSKVTSPLIYIAIGAVIGILFSIASSMSFEDELTESQIYCERVEEGSWPDYRNTFERECPHAE